ncbi:carbohydrate kinase [Arthrobacter sp. ISL-5]|nr:carbohydrate kinase [Arthrobacter sp. ISL-5]
MGASRLGMTTNLVTNYGEERSGQLIDDHLLANNVTVINAGNLTTGQMTLTVDTGGSAVHRLDSSPGVSIATLPALAAIEDSTHVHTGSMATSLEPGSTAVYSLLAGARSHATISFDPNCLPGLTPKVGDARAKVEKFVRISDIVKASSEDLSWLHPQMSLETAARQWQRMGAAIVIVTRGHESPVICTDKTIIRLRTASNPLPDSVGAEDCFMAGLVAGLYQLELLGAPARKGLRVLSSDTLFGLAAYAHRAAAVACSRPGVTPWTHGTRQPAAAGACDEISTLNSVPSPAKAVMASGIHTTLSCDPQRRSTAAHRPASLSRHGTSHCCLPVPPHLEPYGPSARYDFFL